MAEGAQRAASVKLSLDSGEYLVELRRVGEENKKVADEGKRKFDAMGRGIDAAKKSLSGLWSSAKQGIKTLGTLGGAFTATAAAKHAINLDAKFRALAFRASVATRELVTAKQVHEDVARAAAKTSRTSDEMVDAFDRVFGATKDLDYARDSLEAIGDTATATGQSVDTVATIAQQLQRKFGATADDLRDNLAKIFEGAQQGGPAFADFAQVLDVVGAEMVQAGLEGQRGLDFLIGALNAADAKSGGLQKQVAGLVGMFTKLGNVNQLKNIAKDLGIDSKELINEKDALNRLNMILRHGERGLARLKAVFIGPEEMKQFQILFATPFEDALNRAKASGLKGKNAVDQAMGVLQSQIGQFGKAALTGADIQKHAASEATAPAAQLRKALEQLEQSFGQPEIIEAINDLSKALPHLAKIFATFVSFAAKNPLLAAGLGLGAQVGGSFLNAAAREIFAAHLSGAKGAAPVLAGGVAQGASAGSKMLAGAGAAFGVAAGAAIALAAGKAAIDAHFEGETGKQKGLFAATFTRGRPKTKRERDEQIAELEASIASTKGMGEGFTNNLFRGISRTFLGRENTPDSRVQAEKAREEARKRIEELRGMSFDRPAAPEPAAAAGAPARRVALDPGAPRLIGSAISDALGGKTLNVRIVNGPGVSAAPRSFGGGGHGPMNLPRAAAGGGT